MNLVQNFDETGYEFHNLKYVAPKRAVKADENPHEAVQRSSRKSVSLLSQ
jgi:hypothetical protein